MFELQYLDANLDHADINEFDQLSDAIQTAGECDWAHAFNIYGMGQRMSAINVGHGADQLTWLGKLM